MLANNRCNLLRNATVLRSETVFVAKAVNNCNDRVFKQDIDNYGVLLKIKKAYFGINIISCNYLRNSSHSYFLYIVSNIEKYNSL